MNKKNFLILTMILALLMGGCAGREVQEETAAPAETEAPTEQSVIYAPDFTVVDAEGNEVKLSDFIGKPIILNFWASWCGPCKSEMPELEAAYQTWNEEIQFLMVNLTDGSYETMESAQEFLAGTEYTFPVYFDTFYDAATTYGVSSIPATYFIDADGAVAARFVGAIDAESLETGISMIYDA